LHQAARKAREATGLLWAPRFFHQPDGPTGPWQLKPGVEAALTAAVFGGGAAAAFAAAPVTPEVPLRRSAGAEAPVV
jgi:hypothetical protein